MSACQCEHVKHFAHPDEHDEYDAHLYLEAEATTSVKTEYGTFHLCSYCESECLNACVRCGLGNGCGCTAEKCDNLCEGCHQEAVLLVNGHAVCPNCVDLATEEGEEPDVQALEG